MKSTLRDHGGAVPSWGYRGLFLSNSLPLADTMAVLVGFAEFGGLACLVIVVALCVRGF